MKLLHLIKDEKFPDSAYEFFEAVAPGQSTYMLDGQTAPIQYLQKVTPLRVSKYAFWNKSFVKSISSYDAVILHSLYSFSLEVLARIDPKVPVVWVGMGYDYYDLVSGKAENLLKSETRKYHNPAKGKGRWSPVRVMKGVARRLLHPNVSRKKHLIKRIDLFAPVLQGEHSLVRAAVGDPFPDYIRWNYGKIADLVDGKLGNRTVSGKNILVGNSAAPTNNHMDVFLKLLEVGVPAHSKVIVPLSYGNLEYREKVLQEGERLFGSQFVPITEFMALEEYIELLSSCSSVVMGHLRQQAAGNLFISLFLGARVFLEVENPLYEEFSSMGLEVNTSNMLRSQDLDEPLPPGIVSQHQNILKQARGREAFEHYTSKLIAELERLHREKVV